MPVNYRVRYGGALIGLAEAWAIMKVVCSNWWQLDKEGFLMEKEAAKQLGVKYGLLANSGSSAGLLALAALELPKGSEVVIPGVTFPTIFNIILQNGLKPVVADCKVGTYNLDLDKLQASLKKGKGKIKAIIAVHAVGNPVDMPRLMRLAKKYKLKVLEDNCDGWGGMINGKKLGSFGDVSFTSFHAAHIVAMGEGGGMFTNDPLIAKNARMYRDWGRQADVSDRTNTKWKKLPKDYDSRFIYEKVGWNLKPLELQAAMGRVQLRKADMIKRSRKANYEWLRSELSKIPGLVMPEVVKGADPCWFALPLTTNGKRGPLVSHLEKNGIETRSMFAANIIRHPAYTKDMYRLLHPLTGCDYILEHSFWIGVHPRMTQSDREYVVEVFQDYYDSLT